MGEGSALKASYPPALCVGLIERLGARRKALDP